MILITFISIACCLGLVAFILDRVADIVKAKAEATRPQYIIQQPETQNLPVPLPEQIPSEPASSHDLFLEVMKELGCEAEHVEDDSEICYRFVHSETEFFAYVENTSHILRLYCEDIYTFPFERLLSMLCFIYDANNTYLYQHFYIKYDEDGSKFILGLMYETLYIHKEELLTLLQQMPQIVKLVPIRIKSEVSEKSWAELPYFNRRGYILLREAELAHQDQQIVCNPAKPLTVGSLIATLFDETEAIEVREMSIISEGKTTRLKDALEIFNYNIIPAVYKTKGSKLLHNSFLQVHTERNYYLISLNALSQSEFAVYIRIDAMQTRRMHEFDRGEILTPQTNVVTVMASYDKTTTNNHHEEIRYLLADAKAKVAEGREAELSSEQKILLKFKNEDYSAGIFLGTKRFLEKRYYESIEILRPLFQEMMSKFHSYNDSQKEMFFEVAYKLGFAYTELQQYDRAYYYLQLVYGIKIKYTTEYINALAEAKDIRVFCEIDKLLDASREMYDKEELSDEQRESHDKFIEFLFRRRGYSCINFGFLDDAESLFKKMLDAPHSHDYAENELKYIESLRKKQQEQKEQQPPEKNSPTDNFQRFTKP